MKDRRDFLKAALVAALISSEGQAANAGTKPLRKQALSTPFNGMEANMLEVTFPPGAISPVHQHPGFVLGYVLEGEFRFQIKGEDERILKAGETFYEPPGAVHVISANASRERPARILAIIIADAGTPLLRPAD